MTITIELPDEPEEFFGTCNPIARFQWQAYRAAVDIKDAGNKLVRLGKRRKILGFAHGKKAPAGVVPAEYTNIKKGQWVWLQIYGLATLLTK